MEDSSSLVLDQQQKERIESVHRGFLYQHLFAVACLFKSEGTNATSISVESDEDIEIRHSGGCIYIQVKTRSSSLKYADLKKSLSLFDKLKDEHESGRRQGEAKIVFVSNQHPGPELLKLITNGELPNGVSIQSPGNLLGELDEIPIPPSWGSINEALSWCVVSASSIPFRKLDPETLTKKLASQVILASSGTAPFQDHCFVIENLPKLFEQIVMELQQFPEPLDSYLAQEDEPAFISENKIRIIVGFSGAGKTSWVSNAASSHPSKCIYFDVRSRPSDAVPTALAQEIAAHLNEAFPRFEAQDHLLSFATGEEWLRRINKFAIAEGIQLLLVLDNAHEVAAHNLKTIADALHAIQMVILCQPCQAIEELELRLAITHERLNGWNLDTIAKAVSRAGIIAKPEILQRAKNLTGGLPLYVESLLKISVDEYQGDLGKFCEALEVGTQITTTAQENIIEALFESLSDEARSVIGLLSFCGIQLSQDELDEILMKPLELTRAKLAKQVRSLRTIGGVVVYPGQRICVHDAIRVFGKKEFNNIPKEKKERILERLFEVITQSLNEARNVKRISLLMETGITLGKIDLCVQFLGEEMVHELGIKEDLWNFLEEISKYGHEDPKVEFGVLDALVFRALKLGKGGDQLPLVNRMENLVQCHNLDDTMRMTMLSKKMICSAHASDEKMVHLCLEQLEALIPLSSEH